MKACTCDCHGALKQRLHSHYKVDEATGCWMWQRQLDKDGYGRFWSERRYIQAHRAAYLLLVGPIPEGYQVDHLCRVPSCVNPEHLEAVTPQENTCRQPRVQLARARRLATELATP